MRRTHRNGEACWFHHWKRYMHTVYTSTAQYTYTQHIIHYTIIQCIISKALYFKARNVDNILYTTQHIVYNIDITSISCIQYNTIYYRFHNIYSILQQRIFNIEQSVYIHCTLICSVYITCCISQHVICSILYATQYVQHIYSIL